MIRKIDNLEQLIEVAKSEHFRGIYDVPDEIYFHPACPGLSRSDLVEFEKSPMSYLVKMPATESDALRFGTAFHCYVLEPLKFLETYKLMPEFKGPRGGVLKGEKKDLAIQNWKIENAGKTGISEDDLTTIERMKNTCFKNPNIKKIFNDPENKYFEATIFARCPSTNILLRGKVDCLKVENDEANIYDLKTCRKGGASFHGFRKSLLSREYGYYWQTVFYKYLIEHGMKKEVDSFEFVCVEKEWPHLNSIFRIEPDNMELGESRLIQLLEQYKKCDETKNWHGYEPEPQVMTIPSYLFED